MKNKTCLALLFILLMGLVTACANSTATVQPANTPRPTETSQPLASSADVEAVAQDLMDLLTRGDFDRVVVHFDAKMQEVLPPDKLQETWRALVAQVGPFQRQLGVRTEEREGYSLVFVTTEFAQATLDAQVAFNKAGQVTGMFFVPIQVAVEPQESYVPPDYVQPGVFLERDVIVGSGEWLLPGTLTLPEGEGPFSAIVLVHDSGPHDRDETIGLNKPFRDLAWGLASQGIAVLRYEKRTKEHTDKVLAVHEEFTVQEETIEDALAAVSLLRELKAIDAERIFVLGHSLGGMLVPRIGVQDSDIAGFVVLAGTTRPLEDVFLEQVDYIFALDGELSDRETEMLAQFEQQVANVKDPGLSSETPASDLLLDVPASYWLDLRGYDPPEVAKGLSQPMLILQGERDYQVTLEDFAGWQEALASRESVTFQLYPTLNHLFVEGEGLGTPEEDYTTFGHVAEVVINEIAAWIEQH
jgi:dienelactone hydrolase